MKTEFELQAYWRQPNGSFKLEKATGLAYIVPSRKNVHGEMMPTEVRFGDGFVERQLKEKDLEKFAVNILMALKSKRLKP